MSESMRCRGMRDILPAEMARFRRVEQAFRDVCLGWGYGEIRTPTIEHLHLFTAAGTLSPQMLGRVYSFLDWDGWSGERVVLRPESTIPTARLYVEQFAGQEAAKLFYIQNVLRFAEGDESREDWQCGVELIGDSQPLADLEIILVACEVLQRLGVDADLKLSDPGILRAVLSKAGFDKAEQLALYDRVLDGDETALDEAQSRLPESSARIKGLLSVEGEGVQYLSNLGSALLPVIPEIAPVLDELTAVSEVLARIGVKHRIAPVLVRNFEYYTGPVFNLYAGGQKLGGGGRYDALVSLVGGVSAPASGFALDIDTISPLLLDAEVGESQTIAIRPAGKGSADLAAAFSLARTLRQSDVRVEIAGEPQERSRVDVAASSSGFVFTDDGGEPRLLAGVDDVARAVAESRR
jgi:histidyl-tRNA synthetase